MSAAMDENELDSVFLNLQRDKKPGESYTQFFLRKGARGVILRTTKRTRQVCEAIADEGFPSLVVGDRFEREDINYIYCDSRAYQLPRCGTLDRPWSSPYRFGD